jgi:transposase
VVAVTVVAEVGDFRRFANARQLMAYLGLVPSEYSSLATVRRGDITKAGNVLARRVLIEGAWEPRPSPGQALPHGGARQPQTSRPQ